MISDKKVKKMVDIYIMKNLEEFVPPFTLRKYMYNGKHHYDLEINGGMGCFSGETIAGALESYLNHDSGTATRHKVMEAEGIERVS